MACSVDLRERVVNAVRVEKMTQKAVALRFSVSVSSVKRWLGLESLAPQKPGPTCSQTVNAQALKELVQTQPDLYLDEYAKLLGSHPSTIFYNLKKLGLTRKKKPSDTKKETRPKAKHLSRKSRLYPLPTLFI